MITALAIAMLLVLLRVSAFVVFLPPLAGGNAPHAVKVGLAVCLTALWSMRFAPAVAATLTPTVLDSWLLLGWLAVRETLFGAALGWMLGLILVPVRVAGAYVVEEMGLTMSSVTSATDPTQSNVVSQLFEIVAVLALFGLNVHHQFLRLLAATFEAFPLGRSWPIPDRDWLIASIAGTTEYGLALVAPVGVILFATLLVTLFVMRQTPQFNLFTFGMPARLSMGLLALLWFLPGIITRMIHGLTNFAHWSGM